MATKEVIGPLTLGLLGMIFVPGALFRLVQYLLPPLTMDDKFICEFVLDSIFLLLTTKSSHACVPRNLHVGWAHALNVRDIQCVGIVVTIYPRQGVFGGNAVAQPRTRESQRDFAFGSCSGWGFPIG